MAIEKKKKMFPTIQCLINYTGWGKTPNSMDKMCLN